MSRPLLKLVVKNRPEQTFTQDFWPKYPRKEAKKDAMSAWIDLDPNESLVLDIVQALEWQGHLWLHVEKRQTNHIPLPASYIRAERWTDERPASLKSFKVKQLAQQQTAVDEQYETAKRFEELMSKGLTREEAREIVHREKGWIE